MPFEIELIGFLTSISTSVFFIPKLNHNPPFLLRCPQIVFLKILSIVKK